MPFHHQPCYILTLWFEVTISKKLYVSLLLNSWLQLVEQCIEKFYRNSVEILMFLSFAFIILFHTSLICIVWFLIQNFVEIVDIEMNYIERYKVENIFQKNFLILVTLLKNVRIFNFVITLKLYSLLFNWGNGVSQRIWTPGSTVRKDA